jgi:hypothetical protein
MDSKIPLFSASKLDCTSCHLETIPAFPHVQIEHRFSAPTGAPGKRAPFKQPKKRTSINMIAIMTEFPWWRLPRTLPEKLRRSAR